MPPQCCVCFDNQPLPLSRLFLCTVGSCLNVVRSNGAAGTQYVGHAQLRRHQRLPSRRPLSPLTQYSLSPSCQTLSLSPSRRPHSPLTQYSLSPSCQILPLPHAVLSLSLTPDSLSPPHVRFFLPLTPESHFALTAPPPPSHRLLSPLTLYSLPFTSDSLSLPHARISLCSNRPPPPSHRLLSPITLYSLPFTSDSLSPSRQNLPLLEPAPAHPPSIPLHAVLSPPSPSRRSLFPHEEKSGRRFLTFLGVRPSRRVQPDREPFPLLKLFIPAFLHPSHAIIFISSSLSPLRSHNSIRVTYFFFIAVLSFRPSIIGIFPLLSLSVCSLTSSAYLVPPPPLTASHHMPAFCANLSLPSLFPFHFYFVTTCRLLHIRSSSLSFSLFNPTHCSLRVFLHSFTHSSFSFI
ncbi:hypothetical protein C7M84_025270 [Penaeus vannamei]|uniref:Uncharacterized protein n=1 Tax=Penaeus vannamei TaxID=6689 RepID=A0A423TYS0_PENVA|nr:hypothetical protein C7M84_025270 [Penaeus vannamei]